MKAISLWQPWASLVALQFKKFETRSWKPPKSLIGEPLAIHAAKRWTVEEARFMKQFVLRFPAVGATLAPDHLLRPPLGVVLCACTLVDYHPTELIRDSLSEQELAFGNYDDGRFAWELEFIRAPKDPIPAQGKQGIWDWNP